MGKIKRFILTHYFLISFLQFSFYSLFALIIVMKTMHRDLNDWNVFYNAFKIFLANPRNLYAEGVNYFYLPPFVCVFCIFSFLSYETSKLAFFFINYVVFVLVIFVFNKILKLRIEKDSRRLLYLLIISQGFAIIYIYWRSQTKFIVLLLFLVFLQKEMQYELENKEENLKFKFLNYNLLAFALGMTPYYAFMIFIYLFHNVKIKDIFKRKNVKNYILLFLIFAYQNFILIIYPSLIIEFLQQGILRETIMTLPMIFLSDFNIQINYLLLNVIKIVLIAIVIVATFFISFHRNLSIQNKISLFFFVYLFADIYRGDLTIIVIIPFILLLFIDYNKLLALNFFNKKKIIFFMGIFSLYLILLTPPLYIFYYNLHLEESLLTLLSFRYLIFVMMLLISFTYLKFYIKIPL